MAKKKHNGPKILVFDIETAPLIGYLWSIWQQGIGLNQIEKDWYILSWAAKWYGDPKSKVMYQDQRNEKDIENDKKLVTGIWKLLDEADIVITQNGKKFDEKRLNTRFILHGMQPPSKFRHIDTYQIAKRKFNFTSNRLEYLTAKLNKKEKKNKHKKYEGFSLWKGCLDGDLGAWKEMKKYNIQDILSLEELYDRLLPWDNSINFDMYHDDEVPTCNCGSQKLKKNGFVYSNCSVFQRFRCTECGSEYRSAVADKDKKKSRVRRI